MAVSDPDGAIKLLELGVRAVGEGLETINDRQDRHWWKWLCAGGGLIALVIVVAFLSS